MLITYVRLIVCNASYIFTCKVYILIRYSVKSVIRELLQCSYGGTLDFLLKYYKVCYKPKQKHLVAISVTISFGAPL